EALAGDLEGRLTMRAAPELAERDVHQLDEPCEAARDELAEGHQVALVVSLRERPVAQQRDAVGVALGLAGRSRAQRHADRHRRALAPSVRRDPLRELRGRGAPGHGPGGLW